MRWLRRGVVAVAVLVCSATLWVQFAGPAAHTARFEPSDYPHLANYNGLQQTWQVPFYAADSLTIARRGAPARALMDLNPHALTLLYERTLQVDLCCTRALYGMNTTQVPAGWWLLEAGSKLSRPITARQQWITVADPRPFKRCQDLLVGHENMHIWSISGHRLHVLRGYYSTPQPHPAGALIAPHYSYRQDLSNCRIFGGRGTDVRPWSFNLSTLCPRWHGQTWADYLAHYIAALVRHGGWRGVFYDNLLDLPASPLVDVNGDGRADGGLVGGVDVWRAGERALLAETHRLLPGKTILVNGDLLINGVAKGREMEAFPTIPGTAVSAAIDSYLYDTDSGLPLSIVNPDSVTRQVPSMPAVQLAVGASLLGNGYVAYDYGWLDHGTPWWFDEYDDGAGSALVRAVNATTTRLPVAHLRSFKAGDVVLLDSEAARVVNLGLHWLVVQRGVLGTTPAPHIARTVVTTLQQRMDGSGYLGRPKGPARLVPTLPWERYRVPVQLQRGPALVDGRAQTVPALTVQPQMTLRLFSTGYYNPRVVRATLFVPPSAYTLRTAEFDARGPQGQQLYLFAGGHDGSPLVLRSGWHHYVLPIGRTSHILFAAGRVRGHVLIRGIRLYTIQAFVWRRDFTHGIVLVNPTDTMQRVKLERPYQALSGDQNPWANNGQVVRAVSIARYRATILLDTPQHS